MQIRQFLIILSLLVSLAFQGCAGVSPQELREGGAASGSLTQIVLPQTTKEKALDRITEVMKAHAFQPTSVSPQLAVYEKVIDSQGSQAFWGRNRTIRVSYSLSEEQANIKISGNIAGIASTHPGLLNARNPGSQRTVDLMGKEKYVSFLRELLDEIKNRRVG
jgi:hypothetical protein